MTKEIKLIALDETNSKIDKIEKQLQILNKDTK